MGRKTTLLGHLLQGIEECSGTPCLSGARVRAMSTISIGELRKTRPRRGADMLSVLKHHTVDAMVEHRALDAGFSSKNGHSAQVISSQPNPLGAIVVVPSARRGRIVRVELVVVWTVVPIGRIERGSGKTRLVF